MNSYKIWNFAEGNDSYYSSMLVDLTQPRDKVSGLLFHYYLIVGAGSRKIADICENVCGFKRNNKLTCVVSVTWCAVGI